MKIETERLTLREISKKDKTELIENINDLEITKWLFVVPYPYNDKDADWWINECKKQEKEKPRKDYNLVIELKEGKNLIGAIGLSKVNPIQGTAEIGYWLGKRYHQKGYGSEALEAMIDFAFNKLKLRRLEAGVFAGNPSSGKLLEKYGFKLEGLKMQAKVCKADGQIKDEYMYGLLREEYEK